MSLLLSLELTNFQPHKKRVIEFDPHVTVLVGPNGVGKSSVIRALRWVAFNRPLGDSVIRWGQDFARVKLTTETHKIVREKGDDKNTYRLDGQTFAAFGVSVPDAITSAIGLAEINFQKQIEAGFWFVHSASEVAREMNRVVDLDVIDRSQSYSSSKVRATNAEVKALEGLLEDAKVRSGRLRWVPKAEKLLQEHDRIAQARDRATRRLQGIQSLVEQIRESQKGTAAIPDISKIEQSIAQLITVRTRLDSLETLLSKINSERERRCELRTQIEVLEEEAEREKPETCQSCGQVIPSDRES